MENKEDHEIELGESEFDYSFHLACAIATSSNYLSEGSIDGLPGEIADDLKILEQKHRDKYIAKGKKNEK